jgi:hypothetical protein
MRSAIASRDLATVFKLMRHQCSSRTQIGTVTGLAQPDIPLIMCSGRRAIAYSAYAHIADQLGMPRGLLGVADDDETLALHAKTGPRGASPARDCSTCRRRTANLHDPDHTDGPT